MVGRVKVKHIMLKNNWRMVYRKRSATQNWLLNGPSLDILQLNVPERPSQAVYFSLTAAHVKKFFDLHIIMGECYDTSLL